MDFSGNMTKDKKRLFANYMMDIQKQIGFKVSARGWAYLLETQGIVDKSQFDKVEGWIKTCRIEGLLAIDFTDAEVARAFSGVEVGTEETPIQYFGTWLRSALRCGEWYTPDWWKGEDYYIQVVVEKVDLVTLFSPVCEDYHIPIANTRGWSSQMQRAEYARRFKEAEERDLQPVLLYCGDHDPDGIRISDTIKKNLEDLENIVWEDGTTGYSPDNLIVERFGLNYDFIVQHSIPWIDNLMTAAGKYPLDDSRHKNHGYPYVQNYLRNYGVRKCEANAMVIMPDIARQLMEDTITSFLGGGAKDRFIAKQHAVEDEITKFKKDTGVGDIIAQALDLIG